MNQLPEKHAAMADDDQRQSPERIRQLREARYPDYMLAQSALADALRTIFPEMSAAEFGICVSNNSHQTLHEDDKVPPA